MEIELRGHIWTSRRFPDAAQRPSITATGAKPIYVNQFEAAFKSLRKSNRLVVHGCRGVGRTPAEIEKNIDRIHAKGAVVMDAETGRLSTSKHRKAMVEEAVKALANERRGPQKRTKKDRRMPWDMAGIHYFNTTISNDELERRVAIGYAPMSYHTMRRHFRKPRGAPVGRPSAARLAAQN